MRATVPHLLVVVLADGAALVDEVPLSELSFQIKQLVLDVGDVLLAADDERPLENAMFLLQRTNL